MPTQLLSEKYRDQLDGVLSCYDRLIFSGNLQPLCYAKGMTHYLYEQHIRIFDYAQFAQPLTEQIRANAEKLARNLISKSNSSAKRIFAKKTASKPF